jgi:hypothetical protein
MSGDFPQRQVAEEFLGISLSDQGGSATFNNPQASSLGLSESLGPANTGPHSKFSDWPGTFLGLDFGWNHLGLH